MKIKLNTLAPYTEQNEPNPRRTRKIYKRALLSSAEGFNSKVRLDDKSKPFALTPKQAQQAYETSASWGPVAPFSPLRQMRLDIEDYFLDKRTKRLAKRVTSHEGITLVSEQNRALAKQATSLNEYPNKIQSTEDLTKAQLQQLTEVAKLSMLAFMDTNSDLVISEKEFKRYANSIRKDFNNRDKSKTKGVISLVFWGRRGGLVESSGGGRDLTSVTLGNVHQGTNEKFVMGCLNELGIGLGFINTP